MIYTRKLKGISTIFALLLLILAGVLSGYYISKYSSVPGSNLTNTQKTNREIQSLDFAWPPVVNKPYPDLSLVSHTGDVLKLSDLKGKVILLEPVGMNCVACNAFSGGHKKGGYQGTNPQQGVHSIEEYLPRYASGLTLEDERLVLVQLLLFDMNLDAPKPDDARKWAEHFGFDKKDNVYVIVGDERFLGPTSYKASFDMIPGFHLIDKDFILRSDATGYQPKHNLFTQSLPMVPWLVDAVGAVKSNKTDIISKAPATDIFDSFNLSMSVNNAYSAIPHNQTTFSIDIAKMNEEETRYLNTLFSLVDIAVVERVQTLIWYQSKGESGANNSNYEKILSELQQLGTPANLVYVHDLIVQAIQEQKEYFNKWDKNTRFNPMDPLIKSSHGKLIQAYQLLMTLYPQEEKHNKEAFYDHLCALDFI